MRFELACALALLLAGCGDGFATAQKADTIEAYDAYLAETPDGAYAIAATLRIEGLMLEKAREERTVAAYDALLARFPDGTAAKDAKEERLQAAFSAAIADGSEPALQAFLDENPQAPKGMRGQAADAKTLALYPDGFTIGELTITQVNLAEDPKGPLDGWKFSAPVTNTGDQELIALELRLALPNESGRELTSKIWPVVSNSWPIPMPDDASKPMKPGQTREWSWTIGDPPAGWTKQATLKPARLRLAQ